MILSYQVELDDIAAFNLYHASHSPAVRRVKDFCLLTGVVAACLVAPLVAPRFRLLAAYGWQGTAGLALASSLLYCLIYPKLFVRSLDRMARRLVQEKSGDGILGGHELEITPDGVTERTEHNETTTRWSGIVDIAETESHVFIFISPLAAHVIPRERISSGSVSEFTEAARQYWQAA